MSQIPAFLRSLAALVRERLTAGQAVHVTAETAQDLELLAGLEWDTSGYQASADVPDVERVTWPESVTPADIALGWLISSRCTADKNGAVTVPSFRVTDQACVDRAAVCSELSVLACDWAGIVRELGMPRIAEPTGTGESSTINFLGPIEKFSSVNASPYQGTREGARAAWTFVIQQISPYEHTRADCAEHRKWAAARGHMIETYRRELGAMK